MNAMSLLMKRLESRSRELVKEFAGQKVDIHHKVCDMIADEFSVWDGNRLPSWLMYIVAGIMRDEGMTNDPTT
jgi:hypothetical protein